MKGKNERVDSRSSDVQWDKADPAYSLDAGCRGAKCNPECLFHFATGLGPKIFFAGNHGLSGGAWGAEMGFVKWIGRSDFPGARHFHLIGFPLGCLTRG
jgi:hypothetical protein